MKPALIEKFRRTFGVEPEIVARAPGRIEFLGNHTDYNGGTVLGAAIDRSVWVAMSPRADGERRFATDQSAAIVALASSKLDRLSGAQSWVNYPLGVVAALPEFGLRPPGGFDYFAMSDLPVGAGLSSSAAIELASALAFLAATQQSASRETVVNIGRHAENHFVGVPCGILDQGCSGFGKKGHLVFINCRDSTFHTVPLPPGAHFWVFNTHTKHALIDGFYATRHRECMEAAHGLGVNQLADASLATLAAREKNLSPVAAKRARHVLEEIARVESTLRSLRAGDLNAVGKLLTASHRSSQALFQNSTPALDFLVDTLIAAPHVYGARLSGGGFGGAVMALTSTEFGETERNAVAEAYAKRFDAAPDILHLQTADGAVRVN